jgi:hypothetical protein
MIESMKHKARDLGFLKKKIGAWARGVGYRTTMAEMNQ